ncbi:liver carboxylesterase 2-like [Ostrinia furnacalis]|uniref:liver carboxylesterase 2-like n=1 Tax=Ostrinia furnacalis TaxID=93504 RepID=UPI00103CF9F0|nr:liver carboxylesterase 2-like [Ostrinia furnacalis]
MFGMRWYLVVFVVVVPRPLEAVVGGQPAAPPEPDAAVVFTQRHGRSARIEGIKNNDLGYYSFFGIRYAEPPLGPRRFQRPIRRLLLGEQNATSPCQVCPQPDPNFPARMMGHEDCLCLNVFSPKMPGDEKGSPVVVFIHGGNYRTGSATPYGGKHITQEDTILVVPQYRLGSLGFISNGQKEASGNAALFDLQVALTWVKDYIEFFGGDPTRVTMMGQGSGGSAASVMALSSEGRSSHGVVALSGTALSPGTVRSEPDKHARQLAKQTGCPETPVETLVNCLRKLSIDKIVQADSAIAESLTDTTKFLEEITGRKGAGIRVEGEYDKRGLPTLVTEQPSETLKKKKQKVPLLTGVTSAETVRAVFGKYANKLTNLMLNLKNFIKKDIIGGLNTMVEGVDGLLPIKKAALKNILPLGDYEKYYERLSETANSNILEGLTAIARDTGDALFNLPAFKSVQEWSSGAPAFLYSFEFVGNLTKGSYFLPGVPLAEETDISNSMYQPKESGPSHGDELAYIFEPLDASGKSVEPAASQMDARVRKSFVGLITKFAHDVGEAKNKSKLFNITPFSLDTNSFIKITDEVKMDKNFRFCQMGFWGNMVDRIAGSLCSNEIKELLKLSFIPKVVDLTDITEMKPISGLIKPKNPKADPIPKVQNILNPFGL